MIRLQGRVVRYGELWFEEEPARNPGVDILVYRYRAAPLPNARTLRLHSLRSDLSVPAEAIAAAFDTNCRRQLRRAADDGWRYEQFAATPDRLREFADFYDVFARQKGLWLADRHWLSRVAAEGQLLLTCASRAGERFVWHSYLRSGETVQVSNSASWFRDMHADERALVGRANRWLHWQDMLALREAGARSYDWGGMFADESTPERAGINRFKRAFGGTPVLAYECRLPVTLRGRAFLALKDALSRRRMRRLAAERTPTAA